MSFSQHHQISMKELFSSSWRVYKENIRAIIAIFLLTFTIVELCYDLLLTPLSWHADDVSKNTVDFVLFTILGLPFRIAWSTVGALAVIHITFASASGVKLSINEVLLNLSPYYFKAFFASLVVNGIFLIGFILPESAFSVILVIGTYVFSFFILESLVCDDSSAFESLRSSFRFVWKTIWDMRNEMTMLQVMLIFYFLDACSFVDLLVEDRFSLYVLAVSLRDISLSFMCVVCAQFYLLSKSCRYRV